MKAAFDRCVALLALIALAPVMLGVALAVKLTSRGPILFKQKRHGFNNELIEIYKFRSLYVVDQCDPTASKIVTKNDSRVTSVGRFIRKTSMDELPQLFNVLKGDLSLVGPRPHAVESRQADTLFEQVVDGYFARHRVKPGITGWAQINGWRGCTDTPEKLQRRIEHDLHYIEKLVGAVRPADPADHALRAAEDRERLLRRHGRQARLAENPRGRAHHAHRVVADLVDG